MRPVYVLSLGVVCLLRPLAAQTFVNRTPNLDGTWLPDRRAMQFNLIHRFYVSGDVSHTVVNSPTLTWVFRLPGPVAVGTRFGTHSAIPGKNNETELFSRWQLRESRIGGIGMSVTPAWNLKAHSFDGELAADWSPSRFTVTGAVRGMSNAYDGGRARGAIAGGVTLRVNNYVGIGADVASLFDPQPGEQTAWSAGVSFAIPNSPHFFSFQVSNVDVNTIEGSSRRGAFSGGVKKALYGFEFTIPLHYRRFIPWFRPGSGTAPKRPETRIVATVKMTEFEFRSDSIVVSAGQAVEFLNEDPVEHTVTFDAIATSSGMVPKGGTFILRFDRPGIWAYHCTPHPFMRGVIVVR